MTPAELRQWRKAQHLTQEELGQILDVYRGTIIRWEAGLASIPPYLGLALKWIEVERRSAAGATAQQSA